MVYATTLVKFANLRRYFLVPMNVAENFIAMFLVILCCVLTTETKTFHISAITLEGKKLSIFMVWYSLSLAKLKMIFLLDNMSSIQEIICRHDRIATSEEKMIAKRAAQQPKPLFSLLLIPSFSTMSSPGKFDC